MPTETSAPVLGALGATLLLLGALIVAGARAVTGRRAVLRPID